MFLGAKATHPTQFLVLSSRDPNLGVSMLPSTRCEITTKRHLMTLESCMTGTNPARISPLSLSRGGGGLGLGSNGLSLTNEPRFGQNENWIFLRLVWLIWLCTFGFWGEQ